MSSDPRFESPVDGAPVPDARLTDPLDPPTGRPITVAVVISPGAEIVDVAGPWGVFEYVLLDGAEGCAFDLCTVAATPDPVPMSGGMTLVPSHDVSTAPAPDIVVVPALDTELLDHRLLEWLRQAHETTDVTVSVCNGSFVLGEAGLLDGKDATAHHHGYGSLRASFPQANVIRGRRYVEDGRVATAGGLTSGIDLALRIVERYFGRDQARRTADLLEYQGTGWMHPESSSAYAAPAIAPDGRHLCPVCEMEVGAEALHTTTYGGRSWFFCGAWCHDRFQENPSRFPAS